jgi:hypothetical protein
LGRGVLKDLETGKRIRITHRELEGEGFKILFEGEIVEVVCKDGKMRVKR